MDGKYSQMSKRDISMVVESARQAQKEGEARRKQQRMPALCRGWLIMLVQGQDECKRMRIRGQGQEPHKTCIIRFMDAVGQV